MLFRSGPWQTSELSPDMPWPSPCKLRVIEVRTWMATQLPKNVYDCSLLVFDRDSGGMPAFYSFLMVVNGKRAKKSEFIRHEHEAGRSIATPIHHG